MAENVKTFEDYIRDIARWMKSKRIVTISTGTEDLHEAGEVKHLGEIIYIKKRDAKDET